MDAALKMPITSRVNFRMILFAGILLFLLGWPVYTFLSERLTSGIHDRGSYKEVDLKAMGFFQFNDVTGTVNDIPPQYRALDGKRVKLSGEVYSPFSAGGKIAQFQLVYSIAKCCFGPPKVQERVFATVAPDKASKAEYTGAQYHDVIGTLHITMKRNAEANRIEEVYHLDVDEMRPTQ